MQYGPGVHFPLCVQAHDVTYMYMYIVYVYICAYQRPYPLNGPVLGIFAHIAISWMVHPPLALSIKEGIPGKWEVHATTGHPLTQGFVPMSLLLCMDSSSEQQQGLDRASQWCTLLLVFYWLHCKYFQIPY